MKVLLLFVAFLTFILDKAACQLNREARMYFTYANQFLLGFRA